MKQILSSAFNANAAVLYVIAAVVILYVLAQSIFFLVRAVKQSKKIGMDKGVIRRTARRAAIFSIAPAISIFIGVTKWNLVSKSGGFGAKTLFYDLQNILERWKKELPAV